MKFSDALRGAADRAPVEQMQVSTADAAGRVKRERALRVGANGLMGVGAAVVIAFGAVGPLGAASESNAAYDMAPAAEEAVDGGSDVGTMEGGADRSMGLAEQWMCGADFDPYDGAWAWGDASGVTYTVEEPEWDGAEVLLPNTLEANRPVDLISSTDYVVLWDGMIVGRMINETPIQYGPADEPTLPEGEVYERLVPGSEFERLEQWTVLAPVNCWDGAALPGGDYEVHQAWTLAYGNVEDDAAEQATPELFRVAADPVILTVDGERVDDPFGEYLNGDAPVEPVPLPEPIAPQPLPEGSLTPDVAREMFNAHAVEGPWDMAPGTQRWVRMSDSQSSTQDDDWNRNYYGCSWDGQAGASFPATSAELQLLDVGMDLPARINVSYGFVVDDNPLVTSSVTNVSDYTLPGHWSTDVQLYLVKNGSVVAEVHPTNIDRIGMSIEPLNEGMLAPGAVANGRFLWRDVHGCHTNGGPGTIEPGAYTVLTMQAVHVTGGQHAAYGGQVEPLPGFDEQAFIGPRRGDAGIAFRDAPAGLSELTIGDAAEPGMEILPVPDQMDWIELHGWTSLGTVTVN